MIFCYSTSISILAESSSTKYPDSLKRKYLSEKTTRRHIYTSSIFQRSLDFFPLNFLLSSKPFRLQNLVQKSTPFTNSSCSFIVLLAESKVCLRMVSSEILWMRSSYYSIGLTFYEWDLWSREE